MSDWPACNARKPGMASKIPKLEPGPWGGKGYCQKTAGWGFSKTHADSERRSMRCKRHIGAAVNGPRGPEHAMFIHGKFSRFVQELSVPELRAKLTALCDDPELLNISPLVANLVRRMIELNDRTVTEPLDIERNLSFWQRANDQCLANDMSALTLTIADGLAHAQAGWKAEKTWQEIYPLTDRIVKAQAAEIDRRIALGKWIRIEKIQGVREQMADYLKEAVMMYVDDHETQAKILNHVAEHLLMDADRLERMTA